MKEMKELINKLNQYSYEYYTLGKPTISDTTYDGLYDKLIKLEEETGIVLSNSPTQNVGNVTLSKLEKTTHEYPMLSLDKTKDWELFCDYFRNKDAVIMPKCDGLTVSLKYENGKLISAETRGNGIVGEDILHNALTISNIPKRIEYLSPLIIDGEVVCKKDIFNNFNATSFSYIYLLNLTL